MGKRGSVLLACLGLVLTGCGSSGVADPAETVEMAWETWGQDSEAFVELIADNAIWFGQGLDSPVGAAAFEDGIARAVALDTRFSEISCVDSGELDQLTEGVIVRCEGLYSDGRYAAFGTDPQPASGEYAVLDGKIVNAIDYESMPPAWVPFSIEYLAENYPGEIQASCDGPVATGETCGSLQLEKSEEIASAWKAQAEGADT